MTPLIIMDQFGIIQNLHMSRIPQTSFLVGAFFTAFYGKKALVMCQNRARARSEQFSAGLNSWPFPY